MNLPSWLVPWRTIAGLREQVRQDQRDIDLVMTGNASLAAKLIEAQDEIARLHHLNRQGGMPECGVPYGTHGEYGWPLDGSRPYP